MNFAHTVATLPVGARFIAPTPHQAQPSGFSPSTSRVAPGAVVALPSVFPPPSGGRLGGAGGGGARGGALWPV